MALSVPRVIYLSSTDIGLELLNWLRNLDCSIVLEETGNKKISEFPAYDLGISFLYTHRIPSSEFAIPYKWVNFHPGPLPEFRGRNVAYHALMTRASSFGATVHYMDEDFDTGEIIEVCRFPIAPEHTAGDLVLLSRAMLGDLFKKHLPKLLMGRVDSTPQEHLGGYFARAPINDEIELSAEQLLKVRALTVPPHYFAKVSIGGKPYKIVPTDLE